MKKVFALVMALVFIVAMAAGCSNGGSSDTIKVGINYELSGGVATYGNGCLDGIKMAIDEVNAAGGVNGKKIELVTYDNKSDPAEATTLASKMMAQDKVLVALGPATSGNFKATIPEANKNKVPVISGSATADDVTVEFNDDGTVKEVKEYAFRICFNDSFQGVTMANFAKNELKATKAVIYADSSSDYAKGLAKNFKETFLAAGGEIVAEESYVAKDVDFNAVMTGLTGKEFDVMFVPGYYEEVGLIIKQAREHGITVPVLGADGFDSPDLIKLAGAESLNDVYFSNHYSSLDKDPAVEKFIAAFKEKYGKDPDAFNALGYDTAMFAVDAIKRATALTGEAVKEALASTTSFAGVTGTFSVDANHNPVKSIVVIGLKDGVPATSQKVG